jgi:hypothetical protein
MANLIIFISKNGEKVPKITNFGCFFFQIPQVGPLARIPRALINIKWRLS